MADPHIALYTAAQFETVHIRHHHVTDYQVGKFRLNHFKRLPTIFRNVNFLERPTQFIFQVVTQLRFIFYDHNCISGNRIVIGTGYLDIGCL